MLTYTSIYIPARCVTIGLDYDFTLFNVNVLVRSLPYSNSYCFHSVYNIVLEMTVRWWSRLHTYRRIRILPCEGKYPYVKANVVTVRYHYKTANIKDMYIAGRRKHSFNSLSSLTTKKTLKLLPHRMSIIQKASLYQDVVMWIPWIIANGHNAFRK